MLIRQSKPFTSFPFVSNYAVVNTHLSSIPGFQVSVTCQGLEGNGLLQWILSDPELSGPIPPEAGLVTSTGPRQLQLDINDTFISINSLGRPLVEFKCESMESGASVSFYLSDCELHFTPNLFCMCFVTYLFLLM